LLDVHRDLDAFGDRATLGTGVSGLGDPRSFVELCLNLSQDDLDGRLDCDAVHVVPLLMGTVPLRKRRKSSRTGAILWLLLGPPDHEILY
jgi:hypothetical protein